MLVILTKPMHKHALSRARLLPALKGFVKAIRGQKRGPAAVTYSLTSGLDALGYPYKLNPAISDIAADDVVYVNESVSALQWAVKAKQLGHIASLYAGPAISVLPEEHDGIMMSEQIDGILQPCTWVQDLWTRIEPDLKKRMHVWPAGVDAVSPGQTATKPHILVYKKNVPEELCAYILRTLTRKGIAHTVVRYGAYKQQAYFQLLEQATGAIFLSRSESQGLAMVEAWMRGVPTLVWRNTAVEYRGVNIEDPALSAPYLREQVGLFFDGVEDFGKKLDMFVHDQSTFRPHAYAKEHFSHTASARAFLDILGLNQHL